MMRLGIGLIGIGKHGIRYARHILHDLPDARLVAIARRNATLGSRQAAEFGCRWYPDFRDLIAAPDVDAVVAAVPPTQHLALVAAAARAGRPLLLEKPAASSLADGREMLGVARASALPVMVAHTLRYASVVRCVHAARIRLGRLHAIHISQRFEPSPLDWLDDPAISGGGVTLHTGIHSFDLLRFLTGLEAEQVSCDMSAVATSSTEDNFGATIRLSDGTTLACVAGSRATASRSGSLEIAGEHGQILADHVLNTAMILQGTTSSPLPVDAPVPTVREVLRAFVAAVRSGTPMPISLEEGVRAVAIVDACYRAAATRQAVAVEAL